MLESISQVPRPSRYDVPTAVDLVAAGSRGHPITQLLAGHLLGGYNRDTRPFKPYK